MLLDTHVLLWYLGNAPELPPDVAALIEDAPLAYVSAASIWEISIKAASHKLFVSGATVRGYGAVLRIVEECSRIPFELLPISAEHSALAGFVRSRQRDPFDRVLAVQSVVTGNPLVSADKAFDSMMVPAGSARRKVDRVWTPVRRSPRSSS